MIIFKDLSLEKLYHSYVIQGEPDVVSRDLLNYLFENKIINKESPDLYFNNYNNFGIDDSRFIKEWSFNKNISGNKKICILGINFISHEAEKSFLKILEEPHINSHFFLIFPDINFLSPILLSRVQIIKTHNRSDISFSIEQNILKDLLDLPLVKKLELIEKIIKESSDKENPSLLRYRALNIINNIEKEIFQRYCNQKIKKINSNVMEELQKYRIYLNDSNSSAKMILESMTILINQED